MTKTSVCALRDLLNHACPQTRVNDLNLLEWSASRREAIASIAEQIAIAVRRPEENLYYLATHVRT
jgi:GAF domain-containing protein